MSTTKTRYGHTGARTRRFQPRRTDKCCEFEKRGSQSGWTALMRAAALGHLAVVEFLEWRGADRQLRDMVRRAVAGGFESVVACSRARLLW